MLSARLRFAAALALAVTVLRAQDDGGPSRRHSHGPTGAFKLTVPDEPCDIILGRPERTSMSLSVLAYHDLEGFLSYEPAQGGPATALPPRQFPAGYTAVITLAGLAPDQAYRFHFHLRSPADHGDFHGGPEGAFHTARPPGHPFVFTLTADAHLDEHTSSAVYLRTLANIAEEKPDFHIDLGNLFMTDKHPSRAEAAKQYLAERFYLSRIGTVAPVMLALGTHDGESARDDDGTAQCLATWAALQRTTYFPNPIPDLFYSGNASPLRYVGAPQNYYAWEWGDALIVVLDPFRYSRKQRGSDPGWDWTLGADQYRWLEHTLAQSKSAFKFVVIHNLLSGDQASRAGVEIAPFNEWGGRNRDGTDGFRAHRPDFPLPVHALLLRNHVTAVLKAHDNFYARQELDGIAYVMVPQPSFAGDDRVRDLTNYGYKRGVFFGNSGHVRVEVASGQARISYVKSSAGGTVVDSVVLHPR